MNSTAVKLQPESSGAEEINGVPVDALRIELDRILRSRVFVHSHRIRRFLQFVVEECLSGSQHRLKEYLIGLEVFNRQESFDPRVDSIVRVEARRLRAKLEEYYILEGREDEIRIELRKGSYIPVFDFRRAGTHGGSSGAGGARRRSLEIVLRTTDGQDARVSAYLKEAGRRLAHVFIRDGSLQVSANNEGEGTTWLTEHSPVADYVLECRASSEDDTMRVSLQLLRVSTGSYIGSEVIERSERDWQPLEDAGRALSRLLAMGADSGTGRRVLRDGTARTALNHYLQGRYLCKSGTPDNIRNSIGAFTRAVESNSDYASAWAKLAESMLISSIFGYVPPKEIGRMRDAALKAISIDAGLSEAHTALGLVLSIADWDWAGGERELQRAIQLDPNDCSAHLAYGLQLVCRGMLEAAQTELEHAQDIDPAALSTNFAMGWLYSVCGRYDDSIAQHHLVSQLAPDFPLSHLGLGWAHCGKRMHADAIAHFTNAGHLLKNRPLLSGCIGHCYASSGQKDEALRLLQQLMSLSSTQYVSPVNLAAIYAGLGDAERSFMQLDSAAKMHDPALPLSLMNPEFESLRSHARYPALLEKMGLSSAG